MRARNFILLLIVALLAVPASAGAARHPRVVDGYPTSNSQWPFIAALVTHGQNAFDGQFCGGSVITPTVVLTAAHCVEGESAGTIDVLTGLTSLSNEGPGQRIAVRAIRVDPSYNGNTEHHDAALLLLAQPTGAPPIAIAGADGALTAPGAPLTVAGWGINDAAGDTPDDLHAGALRAVSTGSCAAAWGSDISAALMVCAGSAPGHQTDACDGDSGGPLVSSLGGPTRLVGIVAFGSDACGDPSSPGVYTRASAEVPWISQTLGIAPPPASAPAVSTQIGAIHCGPVLCTVDVLASGNTGAIGQIVVTVARGGSRPLQRSATAVAVSPRRWRARIELPFGNSRLSAQPFTKAGAPFGRVGSAAISVTAG